MNDKDKKVISTEQQTLDFSKSKKNSGIIPRKLIFGNPEKISVRLSPDGKYLTYLSSKNGMLNLWLANCENLSAAISITDEKERPITSYFWAYNCQDIFYSRDSDGAENIYWLKYNIKTQKTVQLFPEGTNVTQGIVLSHLLPDKIILLVNDRGDKKYSDAYEINLITLEKKLLFLNNKKFSGFIFDNKFRLRFALLINEDNDEDKKIKFLQLKENGRWEDFMVYSVEDSFGTALLYFHGENENKIYLLDSRDRNTSALFSYDLSNGEKTMIAEDDLCDIGIFTIKPSTGIIQAVYTYYDRKEIKVIDKEIEEDLNFLKKHFGVKYEIVNKTLDDTRWIISFLKQGRFVIEYYLYVRFDSFNNRINKIILLFNSNSLLSQYSICETIPIIIKSRDGLNLVSYLTLPTGIKLDKFGKANAQSPLIMIVHGGPEWRDTENIPEHQFFANRGYAALSVNFRGSSGFGKDFIKAGNLEWGRKMQTDLMDGIDWAINHNIAIKDKIVIMGASYGGYATTAALTMTAPDFFAAGISICGVYDLITLVRNFPPYSLSMVSLLYKPKLGDWDTEEGQKLLASRSPINFVSNIKKPFFIVQGANDPRTTIEQMQEFVNASQKAKIPILYSLYPNEGHGIAVPANIFSNFALIEYFLAKFFGKKIAEDITDDDFNQSSLILNGQSNVNSKIVKEIIEQQFFQKKTIDKKKKN